jgi:hypothetical protein
LAVALAYFPEHRQGLPMAAAGLFVACLVPVYGAKGGQGGGFGSVVSGAVGRTRRVSVDGDSLRVVAAKVEIAEQDSAQPGGMTRPAELGGVHCHSYEGGTFIIQPELRRRGAGERWGGCRRWMYTGTAVAFTGVQRVHRRGRGL